ncbi:unnamed protein product [Caenorhabditis auriculariae]|uniref:Zinc transporter ZIP9 n=1 Tax=Caenorhabditis auriculariae TaxID=2777116 RepID=A0A8S1HM01_9PELO|nr:unnamed protein product [Caenorhabditis auriculariae]
MVEGITFLFVLSTAMFFGSYIAGSIPLMFNLSESRIRMVSIFGAGLLVGTALSVIIPEGVESLYAAQNDAHHSHEHHVPAVVNPAEAKKLLENTKDKQNNEDLPRIIPKDAVLNEAIARAVRRVPSEEVSQRVQGLRSKRQAVHESHTIKENSATNQQDDHKEEHSHSHNIHNQIGTSLVAGFVLMLLVDQIGSAAVSRNDRAGRSRIGISATIGLVVHAAADGVALGSASVINKSDVQLIVFVAIMLHKAPAAFGLVSFLLVESIDRRAIRKHLMIFSFAAPFAALVTFLLIMNVVNGGFITAVRVLDWNFDAFFRLAPFCTSQPFMSSLNWPITKRRIIPWLSTPKPQLPLVVILILLARVTIAGNCC